MDPYPFQVPILTNERSSIKSSLITESRKTERNHTTEVRLPGISPYSRGHWGRKISSSRPFSFTEKVIKNFFRILSKNDPTESNTRVRTWWPVPIRLTETGPSVRGTNPGDSHSCPRISEWQQSSPPKSSIPPCVLYSDVCMKGLEERTSFKARVYEILIWMCETLDGVSVRRDSKLSSLTVHKSCG